MTKQQLINDFLCYNPLNYFDHKKYSWGRVIFDKNNSKSYSSNYAVITSLEKDNSDTVFKTIENFYNNLNIVPKIFFRPDSLSLQTLSPFFEKYGYSLRKFIINIMVQTNASDITNAIDCVVKTIDRPLLKDEEEYALEVEQDGGKDHGVLLLNKQLQNGNVMFFAYNSDKKPVAMAMTECSDHLIYINDVYTSPAYRKQGYAAAIINKITKYAKDNQKIAFLIANDEGPVRLYNKAGFTGAKSNCWWAIKGELPSWCK